MSIGSPQFLTPQTAPDVCRSIMPMPQRVSWASQVLQAPRQRRPVPESKHPRAGIATEVRRPSRHLAQNPNKIEAFIEEVPR